ncbi:MAG: hypothetical protein E7604_03980 [Ruminococcaceae bacterium]|nr:hypothetical protein [Oscillospiraceae bacterium]
MAQFKTIKSYYHYPVRSFLRNKRAYILLACSILCMVILCASVLIYYASSYEADVEMLRRENGPQHTQFYDLDPLLVPSYTERSYIRDYTAVNIYASADNPDELASFSQVYFTEYSEDTADYFHMQLTSGRMPEAFGEILVSDDAERYFSTFTLDEEQPVGVFAQGGYHDISFRVVGTFTSAAPAMQYVFCNDETAAYLRGSGNFGITYTTDVYLTFKGADRNGIKANMDKLIDDVGLVDKDKDGNVTDINYAERNNLLSEVALIPPYYEGATMLVMFLFSILPAGIALAVFIYLDMQKNLRELATLTMIGATWIQIFRMQLLKYGAIFLAVFPFGIAGAAGLMSLVCALTENISADRVFLWFRFDIGAMVILLLLSAAILCGVVFVISKRMTSVAHSQMLSAVHQSGNIFVAKTSDILFTEKNLIERISVLFFTRNRGINRLFCIVVILLVCIYTFFSQQISIEYAEAPDAKEMELVDFYLYGDEAVSIIYDTMTTDTEDAVAAIEHVAGIERRMEISEFYEYIDEILVESDIEKQLVSNAVKNGQFGQTNTGRVWKRNVTDVELIGADEELLHMLVGADVVSGSLDNVYGNEDTIALVVHGWASGNEKFYHEGDVLALRTSYAVEDSSAEDGYSKVRTDWKEYKVGAVIYRPEDHPYEDFITVYTTPDLFTALTGISDVYSYAVRCDSDDEEVLNAVRADLAALEIDYKFTVTDIHEELRQAKLAALHAVLFIAIMQSFVLIVAILLLVAMAHFMLEVRAPSMRAMYLIGAQHTQIARMNILEFMIASVLSSVAGIFASAVIGLFNIGNLSAGLVLFTLTSMALLTAVNVLIPVWVCKMRLKQDLLR